MYDCFFTALYLHYWAVNALFRTDAAHGKASVGFAEQETFVLAVNANPRIVA